MTHGRCADCPAFRVININTPDQAFECRKDPCPVTIKDPTTEFCLHHPLRRLYILAEKAMVGLLAGEGNDGSIYRSIPAMCETAYSVADAMVAEAAKGLLESCPLAEPHEGAPGTERDHVVDPVAPATEDAPARLADTKPESQMSAGVVVDPRNHRDDDSD